MNHRFIHQEHKKYINSLKKKSTIFVFTCGDDEKKKQEGEGEGEGEKHFVAVILCYYQESEM